MRSQGNLSTFRDLDWITVLLYIVLMLIGWINIYGSSYNPDYPSILDTSMRYGKQLLWISLALVLGSGVLLVDNKFYSAFAYYIYGFIMLVLVAVLFVGKEVNGARSWFEIGSFRLQPAELAKFATNLAIAKYCSQFNFKINTIKSYFSLGAILLTPMLLILLQNDTGSALVYSVFLFVLYREGLYGEIIATGFWTVFLFISSLLLPPPILYLILIISVLAFYSVQSGNYQKALWSLVFWGVLWGCLWFSNNLFSLGISPAYVVLIPSGILCLFLLIFGLLKRIKAQIFACLVFLGSVVITSSVDYVFNNVLIQHQKDRVEVLLGLKSDPYGIEYNVRQSKIAIGSGGFAGKGFLKGTQTKFKFVPEQSTDFIFCTVGEEWGFLGTTFVVVLFVVLFLRLVFLAERQRAAFSRIYGYGVACILFFHFAVNIGMTIDLFPVIGIPLPFISYGGSSLWAFTVLLFIFLRLDANRMEQFR